MSEQPPEPGTEVDSNDAGVPYDPPGPDVPREHAGSLAPDTPVSPQSEQPGGTEGVEGADPDRGPDDESNDGDTDEIAESDGSEEDEEQSVPD